VRSASSLSMRWFSSPGKLLMLPPNRPMSLEPIVRASTPGSEVPRSRGGTPLQAPPQIARRYYFAPDGLDRHSERLPAARHYDVLLEEDEGTEGSNLVRRLVFLPSHAAAAAAAAAAPFSRPAVRRSMRSTAAMSTF
jgi:hypothetical protein